MYKITGLNFTKETDDIWDFIREKVEENEELVENWITEGSGVIKIPIIGEKEVGKLVRELADEYLWSSLIDYYIEYTVEIIEEEIGCCGEGFWSGFTIEKL